MQAAPKRSINKSECNECVQQLNPATLIIGCVRFTCFVTGTALESRNRADLPIHRYRCTLRGCSCNLPVGGRKICIGARFTLQGVGTAGVAARPQGMRPVASAVHATGQTVARRPRQSMSRRWAAMAAVSAASPFASAASPQ